MLLSPGLNSGQILITEEKKNKEAPGIMHRHKYQIGELSATKKLSVALHANLSSTLPIKIGYQMSRNKHLVHQ